MPTCLGKERSDDQMASKTYSLSQRLVEIPRGRHQQISTVEGINCLRSLAPFFGVPKPPANDPTHRPPRPHTARHFSTFFLHFAQLYFAPPTDKTPPPHRS